MAKDLPYFKFYCSEWSDGDISLEDMNIQGLFINVCAYYWSNECNLTLTKCKKKFKQVSEKDFDILIESGILKVDNKDNLIINFLNEQINEYADVAVKRSIAGKASAEKRRIEKLEIEQSNNNSTSVEQVLDSCSTQSQLLREEKIREDKIREYITPTSVGAKEPLNLDFEKLKEFWNNKTENTAVPKIQIFSKQRKSKIKKLVVEHGKDSIIKAINNLFESDFCTGKNGNWKADFDFLCQQSSFVKLIEGSYSNIPTIQTQINVSPKSQYKKHE